MISKRLKSKTYYLGLSVMVLGTLQQNLPLVRDALGEWYGWVMMAVGVLICVLREVTHEPISSK